MHPVLQLDINDIEIGLLLNSKDFPYRTLKKGTKCMNGLNYDRILQGLK